MLLYVNYSQGMRAKLRLSFMFKSHTFQYSKKINICQAYIYPRVKGEYIAFCEGDDYWTDPLKLQTQVDFLERNSDVSCCFHMVDIFQQNTGKYEKSFIAYMIHGNKKKKSLQI